MKKPKKPIKPYKESKTITYENTFKVLKRATPYETNDYYNLKDVINKIQSHGDNVFFRIKTGQLYSCDYEAGFVVDFVIELFSKEEVENPSYSKYEKDLKKYEKDLKKYKKDMDKYREYKEQLKLNSGAK